MKGLFYKDLLCSKPYLLFLVLMMALFGILFSASSMEAFAGAMIMVCAMLVVTSMGTDETTGWNQYAAVTPVSARDVVLSKYLLLLFYSFCGVALATVVELVVNLFLHSVDWLQYGILIVMVFGIACVFGAILLPAIFKFGAEKGRYFLIFICLAFLGCVFLLPEISLPLPTGEQVDQWLSQFWPVLPVAVLALLALSYLLSLRIYKRKEW